MPTVRVNIFEGVGPQIPRTFDITGDTYQDVVSTLISAGQYSGQIYGLKGEIIDYDAGITLPEVNYIIPDGPAMPGFTLENADSVYVIDKLKQGSTIRDLYNNLVDQGLPVGSTILGDGHPLLMEDRFDPHSYRQISFLLPTVAATTATVPTPAMPFPTVPVPTPFPTVPNPTLPTPVPTGATIEIITADRGPIPVIVNYGVTTAGMLVQAILPDGFAHPTNHGFRLAIIRPGEFIPQIIEHTQIVPQLVNNQQFYLVPDYETLFNGYAAFVTADVYPDGG